MPELYGNERKDKIRADRSSLSRALAKEQTDHSKTRRELRLARATIAEQCAQIEVTRQFLRDALSETDREIGPSVAIRYRKSFQTEFDEMTKEIEARG
jgi:hypothetical protein